MADNKSVAAAKKSTAKGKKRVKRSVPLGQAHIQATFNNTIITFADNHGNALSASSAGACVFVVARKELRLQHKLRLKRLQKSLRINMA